MNIVGDSARCDSSRTMRQAMAERFRCPICDRMKLNGRNGAGTVQTSYRLGIEGMLSGRTRSCLLVLLLLFGGCAGPMGPPRLPPPPPPPVVTFDGSYQNTIRTLTSFGSGKDQSGWCSSPGQPIITVADGTFTYAVPHPNLPGNATPTFMATMAQDGSFYGASVPGTLSGSVNGSRITGRIDGSGCLYEFSGNRI